MGNELIRKLANYQYDCVRQAIKSSSFNNLKSNKDNKILMINDTEFDVADKDIIGIMTQYALNKSTMDLFYTNYIVSGQQGKNVFYTPLTYSNAILYREDNKIKLEYDVESTLNIGLISNLMCCDEEQIQNIIEQLLDVEECNLEIIMRGLLNMEGIEIKKQKTLVLAVLPNSTAGLLNELKQIAELY